MSFFKDFKEDLSLAVNELLPGEDFEMEEELEDSPEMMVNTLEGDLDIESELSKLDGLLEHVDQDKNPKEPVKHVQIEPEEPVLEKPAKVKPEASPVQKQPAAAKAPASPVQKQPAAKAPVLSKPQTVSGPQAVSKEQPQAEPKKESKSEPLKAVEKEQSIRKAVSSFDTILEPEKPEKKEEDADDLPFDFDALLKEAEEKPQRVQPKPQPQQPKRQMAPAPQPAQSNQRNFDNKKPSTTIKEEIPMNEELTKEMAAASLEDELSTDSLEVTDEVSIITTGTTIKGNLSTTGSFSISGRVEGNVQCNGKLEVTGTIKGNSSSSEVFSDAAKIEGEIMSTGTVKIGLGSVVVGNIAATSAVIAGAVKGDIDVQGPVVVDTSAVIVGNIKSRSVQINNGAVIEGFCSQCYADIDVESLFGDKKGK